MRKDSSEKKIPNKLLANELKARLFDKGFSYTTLPSVKRQTKNHDFEDKKTLVVALGRNSASSQHQVVIKEQSTVFKRPLNKSSSKSKFQETQKSNQEVKYKQERNAQKFQPPVMGLSRVPSADRLGTNRPTSRGFSREGSRAELKESQSTHRLMSQTGMSFNRQQSSKSIINNFQTTKQNFFGTVVDQSRPQTATIINTNMQIQAKNTQSLIQKLSGKQLLEKKLQSRPISSFKKEISTPPVSSTNQSQKMIKFIKVKQEELVIKRPIKQLDRYIQMILKNVAHADEFVYLKKPLSFEEDPYDLEVIDYSLLKKQQKTGKFREYFTISKKGLCLYIENTPKQFQALNDWLEERSSFDRIKSLNFFKQFRKWKTLKMWNKIIMREKIFLISEQLNEKLFFLNNNLRTAMLSVKSKVAALEQLRIIKYTENSYDTQATYNLQKFTKIQKKNRHRIKEIISQCSRTCRSYVNQGFRRCIQHLKSQNKPTSNQFKPTTEDTSKKKVSKNYAPSSKQAAYQKLHFPENMDYEMRSKLRSQCMRLLRFSYFIDFVTLNSLKIIYDSSIEEFKHVMQEKLDSKNIYVLKQDLKEIRSTAEPMFQVQVDFNFRQISELKRQALQPFMLPPGGAHTIEDYKILAYVNYKIPKQNKKTVKSGEQPESDYEERTSFSIELPESLCPQWISLNPTFQNHFTEIINSFQQGLQSLQNFERWSKHQDMNIYRDILEEWDDKISEGPSTADCYLHPDDWIDFALNQANKNEIKAIIHQSFVETTDFVEDLFENFLLLYWEDLQIKYEMFVSEKLADPIESIQYSLEHLVYQKKLFTEKLPFIMDKQILRVNSRTLRLKIQDYPGQCLNNIYLMMPDYMKKLAQDLNSYLNESINSLRNTTSNVEEFVNQMKSLKRIDKKLPQIKDKISFVGQIINVLESLRSHVRGVDKQAPKAWKAIQTNLLQQMTSLQSCISKAEEGAEKNMIRFAEQVSKHLIPILNKEISKMQSLVGDNKYLTFNIDMEVAIDQLEILDKTVKRLEEDAKKYAQYELVLNMPETRFENLQDLRSNLTNRLDLWKGLRDWQMQSQRWMKSVFDEINVEEIKQYSDKYSRIISKCTKKLSANPVLNTFKKLLSTFKDSMPVVIALSNKKLQQDFEYWRHIQKIVKTQFVIDKDFKLKDVIDKEFHIYQNQIIEISTLVKQQQILKVQIQENKTRWTRLEFSVKQYKPEDPRNKDAYVLDQIQELYVELDELLANFSSILSNRYLKRQRQQAEQIQKVVFNATLIIDDWLVVQKNWIYLENIFGSSDIKSKLREESVRFEQIDKNFKNHMRLTFRSKFVNKCLGTHQTWIRYKDTLSQIQKELERYLEDKRNDFPRFYFLSNDQLIEILAKANEIEAIQKNIRKCFECVVKLNFQQNSRYIQSVQSPEKQVFKINKTNINAKGQIQNWLKMLQSTMDQTLRKQVARGFLEYEQSKNRVGFIKQRLSQVALLVCQVNWTLDTEAFIENLDDYYKLQLKQLTELTTLIRDPQLPDQTRRTLVALITQEVHNRDIAEELMEAEGLTRDDFIWSKQLRFYMEGEGFDAVAKARQVDAEVEYGYEYLGIMSRLVITPLTDRCWMTIMGALNIKLGAAPAGPAGTGKTESTKDLAKGMGMLCIVFNCSEQIEFKIMARLFAGLSQQGAWSCLDEFNRIDIEVLSVIAQQLLTIRVAKLRGDSVFYFNERNINLKPGCGVFITMNPGYAGRTQLPDNLKVLFRPVSMMIPDYRLIAQIMLFAEGFQEAKQLSKKMVQLYKLSSEQLSQQDHYDFGMRAVKSVLVMAGALKRKSKDQSEAQVLIQAMRNANIPKFLKEDLPLFEALIRDLFPTLEIKQIEYVQMQNQIRKIALQLGLQQVDNQTKKAIQLYQTFNVRFGVMIVGATNSGKTTCSDLLSLALTRMYKQELQMKIHVPKYCHIKRHTLNPKSISMGELYGQVNELTQDWNDGLASFIMRECTQEEDPYASNWVVFDGPVDALWIQNMNTVLDDNMMLCLANGERIKLTDSMRMLFQVMDLKVASPATVSRCGMVYMIGEDLSWRSIIQSSVDTWCKKMKQLDENDEYWTNQLKGYLMQMFDKTLPAISSFIKKKTKQPIVTSETQLASSLFNILAILCDPENGFKVNQDRQYKKKFLTYAFAYAFIWSCCVTSFDKYHQDISYQCRGLIESVIYPNNQIVQNFYFDPNEVTFRHWHEKLPQFSYHKDQSFFEIIVETVDTCRYSYIIDILKNKNHPVLLTGPSGTGKSIQLMKIDISPLILTSTTTHYQIQSSVESKLDKIRKNLLGTANGKINIVAIDDTNMPAEEQYGAIPPVEVLRSFIDKKGIWDRKERFWKNVQNVSFVCACSPPGGGRNELSPRFTRHFNVFCLPEPSHQSLMRIFKQILEGFLTAHDFIDIIRKSTQSLINATIQVYSLIKKQKLPIPSKFHYTFNLRDVSKVIQGVMEAKRTTCRDIQTLGRLWFHECSRVLKDRLNTEADHHWFTEKLTDVMEVNFRIRKKDGNVYFSNINKLQTRQYEQIVILKKIIPTIEEFQQNHNAQNDSKLNLVLFTEAVEHILRIQRILTMSRGNGLLLGVAGSGKQSLTRLASYISGYQLKQIQITKGYNIDSFRIFLKSIMRECSDKDKSTTFLFTDNQIINEIFLEDINNILNSGEIPNLWELQEKEDIINTTRPFNALLKRPESPMMIYRTFVERVRERLHLILSMSPIGDALRIRCRKYPALVNCCTMNWFFSWPQQALITVASAILQNFENLPSYQNIPKRSEVVQIFADIFKEVHISANLQAKKFEQTLKRKVYTTPKSYLDMLKLYDILFEKKQKEVYEKRDRLTGGLQKLQQAGIQVKSLEKTLIKLKPELEQQNIKLQLALIEVEKDSRQAAEIQAIVSQEAEQVTRQKDQIQELTDQAKQRLREVEPELQKAKKAVETIDRKALQTIRGFQKPPQAVQIIMEGVCILFGIKADWQAQKKLLMRLDDFITSLKEYKKDSIPEDRLMKLRNHIQKPEFREQVLFKKVRQMLEIAQWCKAIEKYATVAREIQPKKRKMAQLQIKLNIANKQLDVKMKVLKQAQDKVKKLQDDTSEMMGRKNALQKQLELTKDRLTRASDLIVLTKDEAVRWKETVEKMSSEVKNLPLDVFVSAASISYNGPFTGPYRKSLVDYWKSVISSKELPMSEDSSVSKTLGDPLLIRDWIINGLPSDTVSIENAIFSKEGNRWPFLIDPQNQAFKWLNRSYAQKPKKVLKLTEINFLHDMKSAIVNGLPVLLIDVEETLPAVLDNIFAKEIKMIDNIPKVKFGDENINYDKRFEIYIFTKLMNPNFLPEVFIRTNIINFTVTFNGLEEQLLAMVVKHEREEVEKQRDDNIVLMGECNKKLNQSELSILRLLKKAKAETILDDIELIDTLKTSQQASKDIKIKMQESKKLQRSITTIRQQYLPVATRGSILFFVIKDLSTIDSMYQYSLQYIEKIIGSSMDSAQKSQHVDQRLTLLINQTTRNIYKSVSRGLFQKDKTLFSFLIATSINRHAKLINDDIWSVFTKGTPPAETVQLRPNPSKSLFSQKSWQLALYLENNYLKFTGLTNSFATRLKQWQNYAEASVLKKALPEGWDLKLQTFERLLVWRILQPQKLALGISYYVIHTMGQYYMESINVSVKDIYKDSDNRTPVIFVLSPGADPTSNLLKFATEINANVDIISLGQGQGQSAARLIHKNKISGKWVLLQNCHLARTWMNSLQKIVQQNFSPQVQIHQNFRLFLTSMPAPYFPPSILQNGIKLTTEPPRGIKANLKRSWNQISEEQLRVCPSNTEPYHKLLWGLTFFHAIIQQRQKFGPLGWNIKYEFNESDLETSKTVLQMLLNKTQGQSIPFQALLFVIGQINYGGRVTDDWDRRCLKTILGNFYRSDILSGTLQFSSCPEYFIPQFQSIENYRGYIDSLPLEDPTLLFGMHSNANITFYQQQEKQIMETLLSLQPRQSTASGKNPQEIVLEIVTSILEKKEIPDPINMSHGHKDIFVRDEKNLLASLNTFLIQEIERFNKLLKVIKKSLEEEQKAINGLVLMSDQLDSMFYSLLINKVPDNWKKYAYPSLKPLKSWIKDLNQRANFIRTWFLQGTVNSYWMSSFFFPQGFLTGVLQQYARQPDKQIAIDQLIFSFKFTDLTKEKCSSKPTEGVYIHGLFLEGGSWDNSKKVLCDPIKNQLHFSMPIVHFIPIKMSDKKSTDKCEIYECPVYKTSVRAGVLSTTGQSTNFVVSVDVPSFEEPERWILQGTALLLQLNE